MSALDDADRRILTQLRLDARITNSALAEAVGLSASACLRRVRLLEQSGVIRGYTAIIAGAAPDEGTVAIVQVELERQTEEYLVRFENALRNHPEVREWYLMTGAGDYVLRVQIAGMEEYATFHRDVLTRLPGVTRINSSFAMRSNRRP
ncbi:MAG: Lrp/AsnC family transcriptional regulator [Candidatus Sphingomonas colombiensis]|nr:Lrp/AsnC family transcriptional regulator [Sphingomonas sp.]WEK44634.1 MAG: Lrp/AsnC family transcriptional regulator [Sphingomonas sp.]